MSSSSTVINHFLLMVMGVVAGMSSQQSSIRVATKHNSDQVEVKIVEGTATIAIRSPAGISEAVLERCDQTWPDKVEVRLHLKGLESFRAASDRLTLNASVGSQDGNVRVWKNDEEDTLLNAKSVDWMELRLIGCDGKPTKVIPITDGYIEIRLPKSLLDSNPKSITLNWIDFYRN